MVKPGNLFKSKGRQKGAVLMLTMIMGIIFSIVAAYTAVRFNKELKKITTKNTKNQKSFVEDEVKSILKIEESCISTFGGRNPNNTPVGTVTNIIRVRSQIDDAVNREGINPTLIPQLGDYITFVSNVNENLAIPYGSFSVKISGFSLQTVAAIGANSSGMAVLNVDLIGKVGTYARNRRATIDLYVETNGLGRINKCFVK